MGWSDKIAKSICGAYGFESVRKDVEEEDLKPLLMKKTEKEKGDNKRKGFSFDFLNTEKNKIYFFTKNKEFAETFNKKGRAFSSMVATALHLPMGKEDVIFCEYVLVIYVEYRRQQFSLSLSEKEKHESFHAMLRFWVDTYKNVFEIRSIKRNIIEAEFGTKFREYYELNRDRAMTGNADGLLDKFSENVCKLADGVFIQGYDRNRAVKTEEFQLIKSLAVLGFGF